MDLLKMKFIRQVEVIYGGNKKGKELEVRFWNGSILKILFINAKNVYYEHYAHIWIYEYIFTKS